MAMHGFYWLIDGLLAGCGRPGHRGRGRPAVRATTPAAPGDAEAAATADAPLAPLDEDLAWLASRGIGAVLSLTEEPLAAGALARHGMAESHLPVDDLRAPSAAQLDAALAFIDEQRLLGRRVLVHCLVGQGRTGTILAAYLIRGGLDADEALREVRAVCPDAVGSAEQEAALRAFAAQRAWVF